LNIDGIQSRAKDSPYQCGNKQEIVEKSNNIMYINAKNGAVPAS